MKEGWEYKKLGECFISINNGANIKQIKGAKGIPITRIETLSNDKFNRGRMGYADILDASPYSSYILNDGDILMSHINSMKYLGRAVQYLKKEDETIIHGMNLLRLVPTKDVLSSFLIYQFFTAFFRNQIVSISHQSVNQASFNTTNLKNLKLKVPPLSEQQSIVDYLDSAFAKIDAMKVNAEKGLNEAKALFQASLKEMLEPKEGCEENTLKTICIFSQGIQVPLSNQFENKGEGLTRFLRIIDFTQGNEPPRYVQIVDRKYWLEKDGIAIVRYGASTGYICTGLEGTLANNLFKVTIKDGIKLFYKYLFWWLNSKTFQSEIKKQMNGAAMPAISFGMINDIKINFPSLQEQQSIVATLDSLKSKVDRLQENFDKISQECDVLKQAILRQVFE